MLGLRSISFFLCTLCSDPAVSGSNKNNAFAGLSISEKWVESGLIGLVLVCQQSASVARHPSALISISVGQPHIPIHKRPSEKPQVGEGAGL